MCIFIKKKRQICRALREMKGGGNCGGRPGPETFMMSANEGVTSAATPSTVTGTPSGMII